MTPRTLGLAVLGVALAGGLAVVAFRDDPVPVDLHTVARASLAVTVTADGRTRIREIWDVAAPITGTARRSPVAVGDRVVEGETLVAVVEPVAPPLLDARARIQAEAALREAEAGLQVAQATVRQAEEDESYTRSQYERTRTLVERGVVSTTQLENMSQLLAVKAAALDAARSNLAMVAGARDRAAAMLIEPGPAEATASCCIEIRAPATGTVLAVAEISERPVLAGAPLLSIGDPSDLEIVADLLSSDAVRLPRGARALVDRWGGPEALEARLIRIDPTARTKVSALGIEEQRVDAVFELVSSPEARPGLGGGFAVFLRIVEWEADGVLQVPLSALFRSDGGWAVYVVRDGIAHLTRVETGRRSATAAEVVSGLSEGDRVVTHPSDALGDGTAVAERSAL